MSLHIYCLIHTALVTMNCADNHCTTRSDGTAGQKRNWPFLPNDKSESTLPAKKMSDIGDRRYISELSTDDLACLNGELDSTENAQNSLTTFNQAFGECSEASKFSQLVTYGESTISQYFDNEAGNIGQTSKNFKLACPSAEACTSQQASYDNITRSYDFAGYLHPSNPLDCNETQNRDKLTNQSPESFLKQPVVDSVGISNPSCRQNQEIQNENVAQWIANLLKMTKWHSVHSDTLKFLDSFGTDEEKFYAVLQGYRLRLQCAEQFFGALGFNHDIIAKDSRSFQIMQEIKHMGNTDIATEQNDNSKIIFLPDFVMYYERCKLDSNCKISKHIILSHKWSILKRTEGHISMYTDISCSVSELILESKESEINNELKMLCVKYYLVPNIVLSKLRWKNDDRYYIVNFLKRFESTKKAEDTELKIESAHYTLERAHDFAAKSAIFKQFIFDTFFCEKSGAIFYTIKAKLWRLQIFMPEIYFYLTWRLKIKHDISVNNEGKEYGLKEEIEILTRVVNEFNMVSQTKIDSDIETINLTLAVKELRFAILVMLGKHFEASTLYQFYKIAHESSITGSYKLYSMKSRDICYILAFVANSNAFDLISHTILDYSKEIVSTRKRKVSMYTLTQKIGTAFKPKRETFKTLQVVIQFLRRIKPYSAKPEIEETNLYILFRYRTVIVTPVSDLRNVNIYIQTFGESLIYFHGIIFNIFAD